MTKKEYFFLEESPYHPGKHILRIDFEAMPKMSSAGSFNILPARLLNLSYAQYLRFCRDILKAEIIGKNEKYPIVYFTPSMETNAFLRLINSRMYLVLWERENPDWKEHQEFLAEKKEQERKEKIIKQYVHHKGNPIR